MIYRITIFHFVNHPIIERVTWMGLAESGASWFQSSRISLRYIRATQLLCFKHELLFQVSRQPIDSGFCR